MAAIWFTPQTPPACSEAKPECAQTAEPAFAKDGRLWLAFSVGDKLYAASSRDAGQNFDPAVVAATVAGGVIDANGEARPKIAALADGTLLVSYTARPEKSYDGAISLVRSTDGGKTFSRPSRFSTRAGQRFDIFLVSPKGRVYAAWLDKRDAAAAKEAGKDFAGSGIAVGWSDDAGKSFAGKKILMDHSCECCRVSAAWAPDGQPVFAWRQVDENNLRDHYVAKLPRMGRRSRADASARMSGRQVAASRAVACNRRGRKLARRLVHQRQDAQGTLLRIERRWREELFLAAEIRRRLEARRRTRRSSSSKGKLYRVWKEFDGATTSILVEASKDLGKSWSAAACRRDNRRDTSDHPEADPPARAALIFLG